jgi:hypothetical protein
MEYVTKTVHCSNETRMSPLRTASHKCGFKSQAETWWFPVSDICSADFSLLSLFWKIKLGLWDHLAVCVSVCVSPITFQCLNQYLRNLVYIYHGTWAHLNGVIYKYLPSVIQTLQPLKPLRQNLNITWIPELFVITIFMYMWCRGHINGIHHKSFPLIIATL